MMTFAKQWKVSLLGCGIAALALTASPARAVPIMDSGETTLQEILDSITVAPIAGVSSIDVQNDQLVPDEYWAITATGGQIATVIIEIAGYANGNILGVYDASNKDTRVALFSGSAVAGDQVLFSINADNSVFVNFADTGIDFLAGNNFGYYLDSNGSGTNIFYSDVGLNDDGFDHLVVFQGNNIDTLQLPNVQPGLFTNNEYIFAWEDLPGGGDKDYNDFVFSAAGIQPVPEPATLGVLVVGLAGVSLAMRRRGRAV